MAEYYPLISRAVVGLREGAPEARRSIYDRARAALTGQLRGMQPPVPEEAISRELAALDEAIARIESEIKPRPTAAEAGPAAVEAALAQIVADPPPAAAGASVPAAMPAPAATPVPAAPPKPVQPSRPAAPLVARRADPPPARASRPTVEPRVAAARPDAPRPAATRPSAPSPVDGKPAGAPAPIPAAETPPPETPVAKPAAAEIPVAAPTPSSPPSAMAPPPTPALPVAPTLVAGPSPAVPTVEAPPIEAAPAIEARAPQRTGAAPDIQADRAGPGAERRDETLRPAVPPQPQAAKPGNLRVWIVAAAALAAVVAIALTAWKLRDNPEELARSAPPAAQQADSAPGKIAERADGSGTTDDSGVADAAGAAATTAAATAPGTGPAQVPVSNPAATATQPAGDQSIPVSYKAAILVSAPDTPERVRTYVGSVVWRSESVSPGQDQPLTTAVRADIDVPEAKLQLVMEIRKNIEPQFPASHTIDLKFTVGADSPIGPVKQIDVPQMRREDAATGEPLIGVPVTITSNYFLVGLTRGDAEARNVAAIKDRGWFDIPMVLENGKPAKITFEKGASGDRVIADALAAWDHP